MTTRDRARARANTQQVAQFTELWIVGSAEEVATITNAAHASGLLMYLSEPAALGGDDPRIRRYLRLRTRTHHR
jgi:hypothetical protein